MRIVSTHRECASVFNVLQELAGELGTHLSVNKISVEKALCIVYQPQAVFRVRPVARCSASMTGGQGASKAMTFTAG